MPGIILVDSVVEDRVACIAGTWLEVWEITWSLKPFDGDVPELRDGSTG